MAEARKLGEVAFNVDDHDASITRTVVVGLGVDSKYTLLNPHVVGSYRVPGAGIYFDFHWAIAASKSILRMQLRERLRELVALRHRIKELDTPEFREAKLKQPFKGFMRSSALKPLEGSVVEFSELVVPDVELTPGLTIYGVVTPSVPYNGGIETPSYFVQRTAVRGIRLLDTEGTFSFELQSNYEFPFEYLHQDLDEAKKHLQDVFKAETLGVLSLDDVRVVPSLEDAKQQE